MSNPIRISISSTAWWYTIRSRSVKVNTKVRSVGVYKTGMSMWIWNQFVLTYYEKADPVKKLVYYDKMVEDYNGRWS